MSIRGYAATITSVLAGIVSHSMLWALTDMELHHVLVWSFFIALGAFIVFAWVTDLPARQSRRKRAQFVTDEATGLSVLIQRSGR